MSFDAVKKIEELKKSDISSQKAVRRKSEDDYEKI